MDFIDPEPRTVFDLANDFLSELGSEFAAPERDAFITMAMLAGQHIAEREAPLHWHAFDAATFDAQIPFREEERTAIYFHLSSFLQWLCIQDVLGPSDTVRILRDIERVAPYCPPRSDLAASSIRAFERMASV